METTTDKHTHGNCPGAAQATQALPSASILDSLMTPTFKELKVAHYRIAAETPEARERAGGEKILQDEVIMLSNPNQPAPELMRRIVALVEIDGEEREMVFLRVRNFS